MKEKYINMIYTRCGFSGLVYRGVLEVLWGLGPQRLEILSLPSLLVDLDTHAEHEYQRTEWIRVMF